MNMRLFRVQPLNLRRQRWDPTTLSLRKRRPRSTGKLSRVLILLGKRTVSLVTWRKAEASPTLLTRRKRTHP